MGYNWTSSGWAGIAEFVQTLRPGAEVHIRRDAIPHPSQVSSFYRSVGLPAGEVADWRMPLAGGRGLHVRESASGFRAHWDRVDLRTNPLEHARLDAPPLWVLGCGLAGAAAGGTSTRGGVWNGAMFGLLFGFLTLPARSRPPSGGRDERDG